MKKPFLKAVSLFVCALFTFQTMAFAAEEILFYHTDPVGTPLAMSNMSGQKVWEADYKPFGEEFSAGGSKGNSKRFVGKEKDSETGLNYFGARYLSGASGRFLAPDPVRAVDPYSSKINVSLLAEPQRLNTYVYSLNSPYRYVDPDGEIAIPIVIGGGILLFGGATYISQNYKGMASSAEGLIERANGAWNALNENNSEQGFSESNRGKYQPPPKDIEGISGLERAKPKTPVQGGGGLRKRWKDKEGNIYEWDSENGTLEKYNKKGARQQNLW